MALKDLKNPKEFVMNFIKELGEQTNKINELDFNSKDFTHFEKVELVEGHCTLLVDNDKPAEIDYLAFVFEDNTCLLYSRQIENYIVLTEPWLKYKQEKSNKSEKKNKKGSEPGKND